MTIHISLDLETWGKRPGFDLRSIGACVMWPHTTGAVGDIHSFIIPGGSTTFYIATENPIISHNEAVGTGDAGYFDGVDTRRKYPLKRDPETVQWWSEQSEAAQAAFANPVDLREALVQFTTWLTMMVSDHDWSAPLNGICLWSHGAAFDPGILAEAYHACNLPIPWHYRAPRDTRTAFDLAGIDDHSAWLGKHPGPLGIDHHALDDAICQARAICGAYERIHAPKRAMGEIANLGSCANGKRRIGDLFQDAIDIAMRHV